jgi:hypothetical protein
MGVKAMLVMATLACDWMFTLTVVRTLIAGSEQPSVPARCLNRHRCASGRIVHAEQRCLPPAATGDRGLVLPSKVNPAGAAVDRTRRQSLPRPCCVTVT